MAPAAAADGWSEAVAGSVAGAVARFCVAPLDVLKIRFQLQTKGVRAGSGATYTGVAQAVATIWQREGIVGLWRGNLTAELLCAAYTGVQFAAFGLLRPQLQGWSSDRPLLGSFVTGGVGGAVATASCYPLDLTRTLFAGQGVPPAFHSYSHLAGSLWRRRGLRGFYAGLSPALLVVVPHTGAMLTFYEAAARACPQLSGRPDFQVGTGMLAGIATRVVTHPLDTLKKRVQMMGVPRHAAYGESMPHAATCAEALRLIVVREGPSALYRGLVPSVLKTAPTTGITFAVHDQVLLWLRRSRA